MVYNIHSYTWMAFITIEYVGNMKYPGHQIYKIQKYNNYRINLNISIFKVSTFFLSPSFFPSLNSCLKGKINIINAIKYRLVLKSSVQRWKPKDKNMLSNFYA